MYVEGISLGYMEMEILSGLRTSACEGRSNCGVMWGSGGDECAAFASLESVEECINAYGFHFLGNG